MKKRTVGKIQIIFGITVILFAIVYYFAYTHYIYSSINRDIDNLNIPSKDIKKYVNNSECQESLEIQTRFFLADYRLEFFNYLRTIINNILFFSITLGVIAISLILQGIYPLSS